MTSQEFGNLALQLLQSATIPGAALDAALAFKMQAQSLVSGDDVIVVASKEKDVS